MRRLPPHVSPKQPFDCGEGEEALARLEAYLAGFAAEAGPVSVEAAEFAAWGSVFAAVVRESPELRALHERLNRELPGVVGGDAAAPFDGAGYRFHLTVAAGGAPPEVYREIAEEYRDAPPLEPFVCRELALFVYDEAEPGRWEYLMYAALPLTGPPS